jgi:hypothetical protein
MTYKMLKAASRLEYRVGISRPKNDLQVGQHGDKLTAFKNAKESFTFFKLSTRMMFSNKLFSKSLIKF